MESGGYSPSLDYFLRIAATLELKIELVPPAKDESTKCKLFCDIDTAFVPSGSIVVSGGLKAVLEYYAGIGEDFLEAVHSMLVFDAVIYNEDIHFGNFRILRNNHSGALIASAYLFDYGLVLFNYARRRH